MSGPEDPGKLEKLGADVEVGRNVRILTSPLEGLTGRIIRCTGPRVEVAVGVGLILEVDRTGSLALDLSAPW
jgi:transcription antitermination factor NusG